MSQSLSKAELCFLVSFHLIPYALLHETWPFDVPSIRFCSADLTIYSCVKLLTCSVPFRRFIPFLKKLASPRKSRKTVKRKLFLNLCLFWQTALRWNTIFHRSDWHSVEQMSDPAHLPDVKEKLEIAVKFSVLGLYDNEQSTRPKYQPSYSNKESVKNQNPAALWLASKNSFCWCGFSSSSFLFSLFYYLAIALSFM